MRPQLGQFFTISDDLQQFVFDHVAHKGERLLEPSFGRGHLLRLFLERDGNYPIDAYEIDSRLEPCVTWGSLGNQQRVHYGDFLRAELPQNYKTIVGNPPFVRTRLACNLYLQFIRKCFEALDEDGGELIFIVPSDFIKLTSAAKLIEEMAQKGCFTHFYFPNNERLFDKASVDVVVFRYERGGHGQTDTVLVNGAVKYCRVTKGIVTFHDTPQIRCADAPGSKTVAELYDVAVGFVSGKDDVFANEDLGNVEILQDKDRVGKYILIHEYPSEDADINAHLEAHKDALLARRIRNFNGNNWFEWGALRNRRLVEANMGQPCIYVRTMTRKPTVAFSGHVQYFGGGLICMIPKHQETPIDALEADVAFLNSQENKQNYMYSGRFKIGHRQLQNIALARAVGDANAVAAPT